ncbi:hypothetical protein [Bradyrhizobium sp. CW9]|uniref:hypothetical protein n=1 Tax=Bradyrhizobium sp. CW9 TaxID=2782689 RepID=UPI003211F61A
MAGTALWLDAIRNFMGAVNRPEPILWITLAAIPLNALLVYLLVYGKFGLPRLELFGAALASTLVNCAMFLAGLWFATSIVLSVTTTCLQVSGNWIGPSCDS